MRPYRLGWARVMAEEGPDLIAWLGRTNVLRDRITFHARVVSKLLLAKINTDFAARKFWHGVPRVPQHFVPITSQI